MYIETYLAGNARKCKLLCSFVLFSGVNLQLETNKLLPYIGHFKILDVYNIVLVYIYIIEFY